MTVIEHETVTISFLFIYIICALCGMHCSRHHLNVHLLFFISFTAGAFFKTTWAAAAFISNDATSTTHPLLGKCWSSDGNGCNALGDGITYMCSGTFVAPEDVTPPKNLIICNWSNDTFDPRVFKDSRLIHLRNLSIHAFIDETDITARQFSHVFPAGLVLETLNVSRLGLTSLSPEGLFDKLASTLRVLDVSHNLLTTLSPATLKPLTSLKIARFLDNPWLCNVDFLWILDSPQESSLLADLSDWTCGPERFTGKPLTAVIQMMKTLRAQCPSRSPYNCTCELSNVVSGAGMGSPMTVDEDNDSLIPVTTVNCTSRGLYRMPPYLPNNTTTLLLTRNMISDVRPLANNPYYRRVLDVYLDQNQVRSIASLEGSEWLTSFRVLSLRGNQLSQIPTYALDHACQKNRNLGQIYLGNNQWSCDCMFTPGFQDLIAKYQSVIRDKDDIRCAKGENDENSQLPIRELSRSVLCQEPRGASLTGLDLLNAALALLIVLVLGKLAYDYWAFKTSGRLPWLVAKMP